MKPYTERGRYISRVLSLREARERTRALSHRRPALLVAGETAVPGHAAEIATWGVAVIAETSSVKALPIGVLFGTEWRVIVEDADEGGARREARGLVTLIEHRPGGFRIEIRLKSPLRPVPARQGA